MPQPDFQAPTRHRFASADDWADFVFNRPLPVGNEPAWFWGTEWSLHFDTRETLRCATEIWESAGKRLAPYSDAQIGQGLHYVISHACSDHLQGLGDETIPANERIRVIRSFTPLFSEIIATRHPQALGHLNEPAGESMGFACYMWWDLLPLLPDPKLESRREVDAAVLETLARILAIPHDAVRESALHGLNHWASAYPEKVHGTIESFLQDNPDLRPELRAYALGAKEGLMI